jgi:hypothetical protein
MDTNQIDQARMLKIMGKGGYWGQRLGSFLGGLTGNRTVQGLLTHAFDKAGDAFADAIPYGNAIAAGARHLIGSGAYVDMPATASAVMQGPQLTTFSDGDMETVRIKSREYLGAVNGTTALFIKTLLLNPGSIQTFPQLSRIAMFYEKYRMNGCEFHFHSTSGETTVGGDTAIGEVIMADTPDSTDQDPISKSQLMRLYDAKQAKPSLDQLHGIERNIRNEEDKYIRHGDPNENIEPKKYDFGKFYFATENMPAAVTRIGELWVAYDITLMCPRDSRGYEVATYAGCTTGANPATQANLFGTLVQQWNSLQLNFDSASNISFPPFVDDGDYLITISLFGVAANNAAFYVTTPTISSITNGTLLQTATNNGSNFAHAGTDSSSSTAAVQSTYAIRVIAPGSNVCVVSFSGVTTRWPGSGGQVTSGALKLTVHRVPQGVYFPLGFNA